MDVQKINECFDWRTEDRQNKLMSYLSFMKTKQWVS